MRTFPTTLAGHRSSELVRRPILARLLAATMRWVARVRSRRELSELTPHQLRDVGLDVDMVRQEIAKPFWR